LSAVFGCVELFRSRDVRVSRQFERLGRNDAVPPKALGALSIPMSLLLIFSGMCLSGLGLAFCCFCSLNARQNFLTFTLTQREWIDAGNDFVPFDGVSVFQFDTQKAAWNWSRHYESIMGPGFPFLVDRDLKWAGLDASDFNQQTRRHEGVSNDRSDHNRRKEPKNTPPSFLPLQVIPSLSKPR
jgi:hypothetical protein